MAHAAVAAWMGRGTVQDAEGLYGVLLSTLSLLLWLVLSYGDEVEGSWVGGGRRRRWIFPFLSRRCCSSIEVWL